MGERELIAGRVARNQARFRSANDRIESVAEEADVDLVPFICECPRRDCTELTKLTLSTVSRISERNELFSVLEKVGTAGEVAAKLDTRARD